MDKRDVPHSFGAFSPTNHVVVALPSQQALDGAMQALRDEGFSGEDLVTYTPQEMVAQADQDIAHAGVGASIGQELNLVKSHRDLALRGHSFLVVPAKDDECVRTITRIAEQHGASRAQRYGRLMIEELIEVGEGLGQVAESPERGLDAQTHSGKEQSPRR